MYRRNGSGSAMMLLHLGESSRPTDRLHAAMIAELPSFPRLCCAWIDPTHALGQSETEPQSLARLSAKDR
jgi:hypothetical protein